MNKYIKLSFVAIISCLFLIFFIFNDFDSEKEAFTDDEEINKNNVQNEDIEIKDLLLPLEYSERRITPISHVILHFTSNVTENPQNPYQIEDIYNVFTNYGVSTHYMIDREGLIYKLVSENRVAYHAGTGSLLDNPAYKDKLNDYSIGIELLAIGTKEEMGPFIDEETYDSLTPSFIGYTDPQYESLTRLLDSIHERHPDVERNKEHVIGHDEYAPERKSDPGSLFDWGRIGY